MLCIQMNILVNPRMKTKTLCILAILFVQFHATNVFAQSGTTWREAQEYSKKFDEQQSKRMADEFERKLNGGTSKREMDRGFDIYLGLLAVGVTLAVVLTYFNRRSNRKLLDEAVSKAYIQTVDSPPPERLGPLTKDDILGMTVEEIAEKISKPKVLVRKSLAELGWSAKNFDGTSAKARDLRIASKTKEFIASGLNAEEARSTARESVLYEIKLEDLRVKEAGLTKPELPLYITICAGTPKDRINKNLICLDKNGGLAKGYKLYGDFSDDASTGFLYDENVEFETFKNPAEFGGNETIILYRKKFSNQARYVGIFVSTCADGIANSKFHGNIKIEFAPKGFFAGSELFEWEVTTLETSQIFLGLVDLRSKPKPSFIRANDLRLVISDDYINENVEEESLLKHFQEIARTIIKDAS